MLNMQLDPPNHPVLPDTLATLCAWQSRGYSFFQGREEGAGVPRTWDDSHAVQMDFDRLHPMTMAPRFTWVLSFREYRENSYVDCDPYVSVTLDVEEVVYHNYLHVREETKMDDHNDPPSSDSEDDSEEQDGTLNDGQ